MTDANDNPRCERAADDELIERYVTDKLSSADAAAFEEHLLTCAACQDAVEVALELRRALPAVPSQRISARPRGIVPRAAAFALAAASVVLLGAGLALVQRSRHGASPVDAGGAIDAPLYLGAAVRDARSPADSIFDVAMTRYAAADYAAAAARLTDVLALDRNAVPALFFRGASYLMLGRARDARVDFSRVIDAGNEVYGAESRYYRARAELALGDRTAALADL